MTTLSLLSTHLLSPPSSTPNNFTFFPNPNPNFTFFSNPNPNFLIFRPNLPKSSARSRTGFSDDEIAPSNPSSRFKHAVNLFNSKEYYACHDVLESLWYTADDPSRTLLHALLQCAVGLHHLLNQNHKGAMMELGEGVCKLRKLNFDEGPFRRFEREVSEVLEFIYQTQMELAACNEDLCVAMEQTERSYQLLGSFAAEERVYGVERDDGGDLQAYVVFRPAEAYGGVNPPRRAKLPELQADGEHLNALDYW